MEFTANGRCCELGCVSTSGGNTNIGNFVIKEAMKASGINVCF